jgi:hypothetical protein
MQANKQYLTVLKLTGFYPAQRLQPQHKATNFSLICIVLIELIADSSLYKIGRMGNCPELTFGLPGATRL